MFLRCKHICIGGIVMALSAGLVAGQSSCGLWGKNGPCLGIVPFKVIVDDAKEGELGSLAAATLGDLAVESGRFRVVADLKCLLKDQGLEDAVTPGTLERRTAISGLDYLVLGEVLQLSVLPRLARGQKPEDFDPSNRRSRVRVTCTVRVRLVEPSSGATKAEAEGNFVRTASIKSLKLEVLGFEEGTGRLRIDDAGTSDLLRKALVDGVKAMRWDLLGILRKHKDA